MQKYPGQYPGSATGACCWHHTEIVLSRCAIKWGSTQCWTQTMTNQKKHFGDVELVSNYCSISLWAYV